VDPDRADELSNSSTHPANRHRRSMLIVWNV
jgi:hypothetical protein